MLNETQQKPLSAEEDFGYKYTHSNKLYDALIRGYFRAIRDLLHLIPAGEVKTALEIGCGEGYSTKQLRSFIPADVRFEASEYLERQVEVAQRMLPDIHIVQEDVLQLKRGDHSLDLIFLLEVLEHIQKYHDALDELSRVSRRYCIIGVPHEPWWRILNMIRGKYWGSLGNTPGHINHWGPRAMRSLVAQHGLKVKAMKLTPPWMIVLVEKVDK